ncbi:MAG: polyprenyl synthetase family protein [Verrucomicrobiota bacterium]
MADQLIDRFSTGIALPKAVAAPRFRKPKKNIPQTKIERDYVLQHVREFVEEANPVPPVPLDELKSLTDRLLESKGINRQYRDYTGILLNNEVWRDILATIPYERRLLLLPKCLRVEEKCPAPFDEFGLLCKQCGLCTIQDFQNEAERLGYAVLVAEGSAIVMSLIQTGKIEAIVGVSCLPVLERTFPYMDAAAIPGIAVPLLQDDCINTTVDDDWVWDVIHLNSEDKTRRLNLNALREDIQGWFAESSLNSIMGQSEGGPESLAREWLACGGNRWRPFLTAAVFQALRKDQGEPIPDDLKKVAVAVECFHKASLVHDDIEDSDAERYGKETLHAEHGIPIALNVGDLLIGEGYRLLASCEAAPEIRSEMIRIASEGQRELCLGQGAELEWNQSPNALPTKKVLGIFKQKTAPAFEVALRIGASYAGKHAEVEGVLKAFSEALGIAYQIKDDLEDIGEDTGLNDLQSIRPSIVLSTTRERAKDEDRKVMDALWSRGYLNGTTPQDIKEMVFRLKANERALRLLENYKEEAIRSLQDLDNPNLKGLLRRVMGKIFNDIEIKGWCHEFEARDASGSEAVVQSS